ncbi:hypothetical protein D3C84_661320 [compost metagenome]
MAVKVQLMAKGPACTLRLVQRSLVWALSSPNCGCPAEAIWPSAGPPSGKPDGASRLWGSH